MSLRDVYTCICTYMVCEIKCYERVYVCTLACTGAINTYQHQPCLMCMHWISSLATMLTQAVFNLHVVVQ